VIDRDTLATVCGGFQLGKEVQGFIDQWTAGRPRRTADGKFRFSPDLEGYLNLWSPLRRR